jgi:uncharacterized protein YdaU (DUF1376 family)
MTTPASKRTPAFQFYPNEFLGSSKVRRMSMAERGIYITLLCSCWLDGSLPTDLTAIAETLHIKDAQFRKLWAHVLHECFVERNGRLVNVRLESERKKQADYRRKQKENASRGWDSRRDATASPPLKSGNAGGQAVGNALLLQSSSSSSISEEQELTSPGDVLFARFTATYPESGRRGGPLVEQAFLGALALVGESELFASLENHVVSEQWSVARKIPAMDKWFRERRWLQRLDPPKNNWGDWRPKEAV